VSNKKKILKCQICGAELPASKNWRRDVQAHSKKHIKGNKYFSAAGLKRTLFKEEVKGG
jgi:hypothetical protein